MFRQASRLLARSINQQPMMARAFSTDVPATPTVDSTFVESWKKVDMVIVPATTGQMGVLPGHVPTIAELKPGVLSVHEGNDVTKYFLSSGFAFIHANSVADIIAIEAVPIDQIDQSLVQKGLQSSLRS
ncbi:hypothetical protein GH714_013741 [Hevea brasiliensis]|uniref:ATP synthase F1 complex delta/epsilon subunit N-terminal domain-containing protein n=1 Tax=Hevea brasiliensis TaxID=3981 RepID=A0A6A6M8F5_HEVBR|nr:hypothetical protein GH714_013741 [Hevea brasiliensis]